MTRRTSTALVALIALLSIAAVNPLQYIDAWTAEARAHGHKLAYAASAEIPAETVSDQPCVDGQSAGEFACAGIDMLSFMPAGDFGAIFGAHTVNDPTGMVSGISDVWGWTDPETGDEIAIVGHTNGTAMIRVTDPLNPVYLGSVPNQAAWQIWHDIKVINDHAVIVSESIPHGMQVFDLTTLRDLDGSLAAVPLPVHGFYPLSAAQHNVVADDDADLAIIVGGTLGFDECSGGLNMLDMSNPLLPLPAGCWAGDAYIHDAQCLTYEGDALPDPEHAGKTICATFAEDHISIVDITDPAAPALLSTAEYNDAYTHQGWFTEDFRYILANDELDEQELGEVTHTRTLLVDTADLDNIKVVEQFMRDGSDGNMPTVAIDHNLYTHEGLVFQSNYESGLRVIDTAGLYLTDDDGNPAREWNEVAYFDTYPADDAAPTTEFNGTWSNYPYFDSGTIVVSGIGEGVFFLKLQDSVTSGE